MVDENRRPDYMILVYDTRNGIDTIGDIVTGASLDPTTGPLDITDMVVQAAINEVGGDYSTGEVGVSDVTISVLDKDGDFNPANFAANPTGNARWFRRGNVIRIWEGDTRVDPDSWPITFTGVIKGQAGVARGRTDGGRAGITFKAVDRTASFNQNKVTTEDFVIATQYITMANAIAQDEMGLAEGEISFSSWGATPAGHDPIQFVDELPMTSIAKLMFTEGLLPRFNGEGKLTHQFASVARSADRVYTDDDLFIRVDAPYHEIDPYNQITVIGLDTDLTKIEGRHQLLASMNLTSGFFDSEIEMPVYWSDDKTTIAEGVSLKVIKALSFGGEESSSDLDAQLGDGTYGAVLSASTGWAPWLAAFFMGTYVGMAWAPNFGSGGLGTVWIQGRTGSAVQSASLGAALFIMTNIGNGVYEWHGTPIEWIHKEIKEIARAAGTLALETSNFDITNHLITEESVAKAMAKTALFREMAKGNPRDIEMLHDLLLEPDDVFQRFDGSTYFVQSISRILTRSQNANRASVSVFEITSGVYG
jgi:hypothetical protein